MPIPWPPLRTQTREAHAKLDSGQPEARSKFQSAERCDIHQGKWFQSARVVVAFPCSHRESHDARSSSLRRANSKANNRLDPTVRGGDSMVSWPPIFRERKTFFKSKIAISEKSSPHDLSLQA